MNLLPRRALPSALALPAGMAAIHARAMVHAQPSQPSNPDAELIRLCGEYIRAVDAYNQSPGTAAPEQDPLQHAVEAIEMQLRGRPAQTLEGVSAKARVARFLATQSGGEDDYSPSVAGGWPEQVVRDLLRLAGEV